MPIFWWGFAKLPIEQRRKILYKKWVGHPLPDQPSAFTEKIQWRIIKDRRELIARGGDKLSMKLHASVADPKVLIPETLWFGENLEDIYERDFGVDWVLKPITGSGHNAFGSGSMKASGIDLDTVRAWNAETLSDVHGEWAYSQARPGFLIEKRIETADGESPNDYRFFVFRGEVKMIQIDTPRTSTVYRRFYRPDWTPLEVRQGGKPLADAVHEPSELPLLIEAAGRIGADFDFIRVDLYTALGQIYFGEITPYPTGGLAPFSDPAFDEELGSYWHLAVRP